MRSVVLSKALGQTPLQAIDAWRQVNPEYIGIPATYAGRLDPMATGKLLVLLGEECRKQAAYRDLDKEYVVEVLLDVATDTGDVLGMPLSFPSKISPRDAQINQALRKEVGTKHVPYPAFSSKTVNGKPLFQYALEETLNTIAIPVHAETIYRISLMEIEHLTKGDLRTRIHHTLAKAPRAPEASKALGADFRQDSIRAAWNTLFADLPEREFLVLKLRVTCASGTYMRTLAERVGAHLGTKGVALGIHRTRIGRYTQLPLWGFWCTQY